MKKIPKHAASRRIVASAPRPKQPPAPDTIKAPTPIDPTQITARHVMRREVLVINANDSIRAAAELIEDSGSQGAAVADSSGQLIGVLTKSDIARSEHLGEDGVGVRRARSREATAEVAEAAGEDEEVYSTDDYDEEILGRLRVADWMTHGVLQVDPETALSSVCRRMLDEGIHRLFVVERGKLLGVVETDDVIRLLAGPALPAPRAPRTPRRRVRSRLP